MTVSVASLSGTIENCVFLVAQKRIEFLPQTLIFYSQFRCNQMSVDHRYFKNEFYTIEVTSSWRSSRLKVTSSWHSSRLKVTGSWHAEKLFVSNWTLIFLTKEEILIKFYSIQTEKKLVGKHFKIYVFLPLLKGSVRENKRGYRLIRYRSLLILLLFVKSIRRKWLKNESYRRA